MWGQPPRLSAARNPALTLILNLNFNLLEVASLIPSRCAPFLPFIARSGILTAPLALCTEPFPNFHSTSVTSDLVPAPKLVVACYSEKSSSRNSSPLLLAPNSTSATPCFSIFCVRTLSLQDFTRTSSAATVLTPSLSMIWKLDPELFSLQVNPLKARHSNQRKAQTPWQPIPSLASVL